MRENAAQGVILKKFRIFFHDYVTFFPINVQKVRAWEGLLDQVGIKPKRETPART